METLLVWQQPQVVYDQGIERDLLEAKSLRRQAAILPLLLGVSTFVVCWLAGQSYTMLIVVVLLSMGLPLLLAQTGAYFRTQRYEIDATGISCFHGRPTLTNRSLIRKVPWHSSLNSSCFFVSLKGEVRLKTFLVGETTKSPRHF